MQTQHEGLELVDANTIVMHYPGYSAITINTGDAYLTFHVDNKRITFTASELPALRDALNCLIETGDFAALDVHSAVPFTGKRMRIKAREKW